MESTAPRTFPFHTAAARTPRPLAASQGDTETPHPWLVFLIPVSILFSLLAINLIG